MWLSFSFPFEYQENKVYGVTVCSIQGGVEKKEEKRALKPKSKSKQVKKKRKRVTVASIPCNLSLGNLVYLTYELLLRRL